MTPQERAALVALLQEALDHMLEREEADGWPGTEPGWSLRQRIKAALAAAPAGEPVGEPTPSEACPICGPEFTSALCGNDIHIKQPTPQPSAPQDGRAELARLRERDSYIGERG